MLLLLLALPVVLCNQLWFDLLNKPVLAPGGHVYFRLSRLVGDQVQGLLQLVLAYADYAVGHVHKDAADVLSFAH